MNNPPERFQVQLPHLNEKQMGLVILSLWLCLRFFFENMVKTNGVAHAYKFKKYLVQNMKNADVTGLTFHNETDALTAVLDLIDKLITFGDDKGPGDKG